MEEQTQTTRQVLLDLFRQIRPLLEDFGNPTGMQRIQRTLSIGMLQRRLEGATEEEAKEGWRMICELADRIQRTRSAHPRL